MGLCFEGDVEPCYELYLACKDSELGAIPRTIGSTLGNEGIPQIDLERTLVVSTLNLAYITLQTEPLGRTPTPSKLHIPSIIFLK